MTHAPGDSAKADGALAELVRPRRLPVVALVLAFLGVVPGLGLLGAVLAIVHLRGRESAFDRRGLAIAAVVLGAVTTLGWGALVAVGWNTIGRLRASTESMGLYEVELATGRARLVVDSPGPEGCGEYVPGTDAVVYSSGEGSERDLYRIRLDGTGRVQLTDLPGAEYDPAVSPDGRRLAFVHGGEWGHRLVVMDLDDGAREVVLGPLLFARQLVFSPGGEALGFVATDDGIAWDAYALDLESGEVQPIFEWEEGSIRVKAVDWGARHIAVGHSRGLRILDLDTDEITDLGVIFTTAVRIDGTRVLYAGRDLGRGEALEGLQSVHAVPIGGGPRDVLYLAASVVVCLDVSADGARVLLPMTPREEK